MNEHGVLAVISGFSGAGKGTLMKALLEKYDNYALSISATTRNPREGEVDGREYFFVTEDRFKEMMEQDALIEYAQYVNHYYGTPKEYVLRQMEQGKDVLLEIEIQGALKVKERFPEAILIFVMPPNAEELKRRLIGRGTESMDVINACLLYTSHTVQSGKRRPFLQAVIRCVPQRASLVVAVGEDRGHVRLVFFINCHTVPPIDFIL